MRIFRWLVWLDKKHHGAPLSGRQAASHRIEGHGGQTRHEEQTTVMSLFSPSTAPRSADTKPRSSRPPCVPLRDQVYGRLERKWSSSVKELRPIHV